MPVGWPAPRSGGERGAAVRTGVRAAMAELLSWGGALLVWDRELEGSCGGVGYFRGGRGVVGCWGSAAASLVAYGFILL